MSNWRKSKLIYQSLIDGEIKLVTEYYLHDSVSLGDVEHQCAEHLKTRIKNASEMVDAAAKIKFNDVIFYNGTTHYEIDPFWDVKVTVDADGGKKVTWRYLIPAQSVDEATERMLAYHKTTMVPVKIKSVVQTDILAIWHPHSELWQGDWHNRMEAMAELGRVSYNMRQGDIFNGDGSARQPDTPPLPPINQLNEGGPLFRVPNPNNVPAVINKGVASIEPTEVDAEDLDNGYEPAEEFHEAKFIPQLGPGASEETDDKDEDDLDTLGDSSDIATATRPKRKVNFSGKSDNKPGRRKPKPKI